jgi:RNA polymerase sigma-B factor
VAVEERVLRQRLHRDPTAEEVAAAVGVSRSTVEEARIATRGYHTSSLDGGVADASPMQVPDDRDDIGDLITRQALHGAVSALTDRERAILRMRFVEERTQSEIGAALGVSQMQVSRLLAGILRKLRVSLTEADAAA